MMTPKSITLAVLVPTVFIKGPSRREKPHIIPAITSDIPPSVSNMVRLSRLMR